MSAVMEKRDLVGRKVGPYILKQKIGQGGFADVYLAYHESAPAWKVAIKVLRTEGRTEEEIAEYRRRFETEARVCFQYNLPRVVRILERRVRDLDGRPCQVMEYVPGGSLQDWIERIRKGEEPPVGEQEAIRLGTEIAESLAALHEKRLVHRDVKPSNIFLDAERHALLGDLGLVQTARSRLRREKAGSLAEAVGDPLYRPPEQATGKPSDFSADVYMWGTTLFELLTLRKFVYNENSRARDFRPDISSWLDEVIAVAVRKDPAERFQTMRAVLDSLRQRQVVAGPKSISPLLGDVPSIHFPGNRLIHRPEGLVEAAAADWDIFAKYFWQERITRWLSDGVKALEAAHDWPLADRWRAYLEVGKRLLREAPKDSLARSAALVEFLKQFETFRPPALEAPAKLDFGLLDVGATGESILRVTNSGGGVLEFRLRSAHPALRVDEAEGIIRLRGGESRKVIVRFTPKEGFLAETPELRLRLESNVGKRDIMVVNAFHQPVLEVWPRHSIDFGEVNIGTTITRVLQVKNPGGSMLEFRLRSEHPSLKVETWGETISLQSMESREVMVSFTPEESFLTEKPELHLCLETNVGKRKIAVAYVIRKPVLGAWPNQGIDFGEVSVGKPVIRTLRLKNIGGSVLRGRVEPGHRTLKLKGGTGEFALDSGKEVLFPVEFTPRSRVNAAMLKIQSNVGTFEIPVHYKLLRSASTGNPIVAGMASGAGLAVVLLTVLMAWFLYSVAHQPPALVGMSYPTPASPITVTNAGQLVPLACWSVEESTTIGAMAYGLLYRITPRDLIDEMGGESVAFSPDGTLLASGGENGTIYLRHVADGKLLRALEGQAWVISVAFSPDGRLLASGTRDDTIRLWRVANGALLNTLKGHTDMVRSVAFSPDGTLLASGSEDDTIRLWRVADGALLNTLEGHISWVDSVAFSPDGTLLASGSADHTIRLWRVADGALLNTLEGDWVDSVAFSPDGTLLASGSSDNTIRLWRVADGTLVRTLEGHTKWVRSVAFSPDGRLVASGSDDDTVRLWRVADGTLLRTLEERSRVDSVAFSPDGTLLASGARDDTVWLWGVKP